MDYVIEREGNITVWLTGWVDGWMVLRKHNWMDEWMNDGRKNGKS